MQDRYRHRDQLTSILSGDKINPNPFVETTLTYALTYIAGKTPQLPAHTFDPARITVLADNDYYSQPHSSSGAGTESGSPPPHTEKNPTRFVKFPTTLRDAHKTGLGSSAALVTALTAAILTHYLGATPGLFDLATEKGRRTLHNLAQAAHCAAQGKVGSGFDVAAAVYGSILYRRFSPSVLESLPEAGSPGFAPALASCVDDPDGSRWDVEVRTDDGRVPSTLALRMCDVDCGSQTVSMVKQVLAWRARDPEGSRALWDDLQAANEELAAILRGDAERGTAPEIRRAVARSRALIRDMGARSGVPIEPDSQTALLDALTENVDGVCGGLVPGAGGFDALALIVRDDEATERRLRDFLADWSSKNGGVVRLLDVKGQKDGVRTESLEQYAGWLH